jgi:hypothetical protein
MVGTRFAIYRVLARRIMVLTSHDQLGNTGRTTGFSLEDTFFEGLKV